MKNLDMLGVASSPFHYAYQSQWGKKMVVQRTKVKKLHFYFFPLHLVFYYWTFRYEIMRPSFHLVAHKSSCFLFWPPSQMTFQEKKLRDSGNNVKRTQHPDLWCILLGMNIHFHLYLPLIPFFLPISSLHVNARCGKNSISGKTITFRFHHYN